VLQFIRNLICPKRERALPTSTPGVASITTTGEPTVDVAIRSSKELRGENGTIPEEMAVLYLSHSLDKMNFGFTIRYDFEPITPPDNISGCGGESFDWFREFVSAWGNCASDANLLITNADGGGCGISSTPGVCTVPGRNISERTEYVSEGSDGFHSNIQSILHEFGHCLGAHHDHDKTMEGLQHPGRAWVDNGEYRYTPTTLGGGTVNKCGERVPEERDEYTKIRVHEFSNCAEDVFRESLED